jgi:hypothetical protein
VDRPHALAIVGTSIVACVILAIVVWHSRHTAEKDAGLASGDARPAGSIRRLP